MDSTITFTVNGQSRTVTTDPRRPLLEVLREDLKLTGTKYGCGEGQCGACTVLIDGRATRSCLVSASSASGAKIVTIEGVEQDGKLSAVQQAFLDEGAFQCGYCTSGMILAATALLAEHRAPTEEQIVEGMNGNICRCGTYPRIREAIHHAAETAAHSK